LYQPDIPQNLGAVLRIAACFAAAVDIIEPCGFLLTDRALRRTAMDYGALVDVRRHDSWAVFLKAPERSAGRLILVETDGAASLYTLAFQPGDTLLFGRESAGSPPQAYAAAAVCAAIPMAPGARSLNVAVCAAVALSEARRQLGLRFPSPAQSG
jgi:tRNA (cytidine/uridine-2'-O-)-methyltransferase